MSDPATSSSFVQGVVHGALVENASSAIALAKAVVSGKFGDEALREQGPLTARADGDLWIVEGSLNKDRAIEGPGRLILKMTRVDARIVSLMFDYVLLPLKNPPIAN